MTQIPKLLWFHSSGFEGSNVFSAEERPDADDIMNIYGPFKSFGEARRDAIKYHQCTRDTANRAIRGLKCLRKEGLSETQL